MEEIEYNEDGKKKFVLTRGILILAVLIVIVLIVVIVIIVKNMGSTDKITMEDYQKLEERMAEEATIYVYQNNIELTEDEVKIDLKDLLEENGGAINKEKVQAAIVCEGYVIAVKKETESYKAYIKCGDEYTTSGYVSNNKTTTTKNTTTKKDTEKPVITLVGPKSTTITVGEIYKELGAKAIDNIDGDITSKIKISGNVDINKVGTYKIGYEVADSAGNKTTIQREVVVLEKATTTTKNTTTKTVTTKNTNTTATTKKRTTTSPRPTAAPTIILKGNKIINLELGDRYSDPGYTASDYSGKNITSSVTVSGVVDTSNEGTYTITYSVSDSYGNRAITTRQVIVKSNKIYVSSIKISPNDFKLSKGNTKTLSIYISPTNATDKSVSWSSSNNSVATVSSNGTVTARSNGTAIITVKTSNGKTATARITVK